MVSSCYTPVSSTCVVWSQKKNTGALLSKKDVVALVVRPVPVSNIPRAKTAVDSLLPKSCRQNKRDKKQKQKAPTPTTKCW